MTPHKETVLIFDLGAQDVQKIARRVREHGVYSEIVGHATDAAEIKRRGARAIILSSVPEALLASGKLNLEQTIAEAQLPVLALGSSESLVPGENVHTATDIDAAVRAESSPSLKTFLEEIAGLSASWVASNIVEDQVAKIREQIGDAKVICALSGGVDSAVAAALVQRAVGDQLIAVFVDHGLLRQGERQQVEVDYVASTGVRLVTVDAREQFLSALSGVADPETKRKIIGREFIRVFEDAQQRLVSEAAESGEPIRYLVQGTIYPDVVESGVGEGTSNIKSHHNVGGLPEDMKFELVEPLRELFKDEVRAVGRELGLPEAIVARQPFPGPGLGIRVIGEVTEERLDILRRADAVVRRELSAAGLDDQIWQCPVVLLAGVRSVGVSNEQRTYGHPVVLRPVWTEDAMTADWVRVPYEVLADISAKITSTVPEINRVVLDITPKPPGTIEWE